MEIIEAGSSIVEVGVWYGSHARQLYRTKPERLYLVDPWRTYAYLDQAESTDRRMVDVDAEKWESAAASVYQWALIDQSTIRILRLRSADAARLLAHTPVDMVYIDGDHSYGAVIQDVLAWLPVVRDGGIIAGHDFSLGWPSVRRAVDHLFRDIDGFTLCQKGQWFCPVIPSMRNAVTYRGEHRLRQNVSMATGA